MSGRLLAGSSDFAVCNIFCTSSIGYGVIGCSGFGLWLRYNSNLGGERS